MAAVPFKEIPAFMAGVRQQNGVGAIALEFAMLNATRTCEAIEARWPEINIGAGLWTIPAEHTKTKIERTIPLSTRAIEILKKMHGLDPHFVFPGAKFWKIDFYRHNVSCIEANAHPTAQMDVV